jgi:ABC-type amino acid transport substrate-binding protein
MLEYGTFEQLEEAVAKEKLDIVIGLAATEQREIVLDLSHPYFRSGSARQEHISPATCAEP